jgi:hypothetical protein
MLIQVIGLVALFAIIAFAYGRWVRPHQVSLEAKGLLLLIVLTMAGGLLGSTGWWTDNPSAFSWDLPPLASRLLGAAGCAFGAACFLTLQRPDRQRLRLILIMLAVYLMPLAVAIMLFHLNRFDPAAPITYAFFILVIGMILPTLWYLYRRPSVLTQDSNVEQPNARLRLWFYVVATVAALWGAALFTTDNGFTPLIWAWTGDLLTSRLIAVMLLTIAAAALYSLRSTSAAQVTLVTMIVYGFGAALAGLLNGVTGKPIPLFYVLALGLMGIVSMFFYLRQKQIHLLA